MQFYLNLNYPVTAMLNLSAEEACPAEIQQAAREIARHLSTAMNESHVLHREVESLRVRYLRSLARGEITEVMPPDLEGQVADLHNRINALVNSEGTRRDSFIRERLQGLRPAMRRELCNHVRGVERYLDCGR